MSPDSEDSCEQVKVLIVTDNDSRGSLEDCEVRDDEDELTCCHNTNKNLVSIAAKKS